jgi:hypothetical protein
MTEHSSADLAKVFEAINAAAKAMPSLRKGDRNQHGGYAYVSIDDYFEQAAAVAHDNGLSWSMREVSSETVVVGEKMVAGKAVPTWAFKVKYEFDLMHVSGVYLESFFSTTILHPLQGAQTAGSAMSYAAKLFMRNVFTVVTGEQDADATPSDAFDLGPSSSPRPVSAPRSAPSPQAVAPPDRRAEAPLPGLPRAEPTADGMNVADLALAFIDLAKTVKQLNDYWIKNESEFKALEKSEPEEYARLVAAFSARKKALK